MSDKNLIEPLPQSELEGKIGYKYKDPSYLTCALTHSSYSNELRAKGRECECNERLEFLGDSVLSTAVSEYLYSEYSQNQEGDLTKIRAGVVCEKALAKYSSEISLGEYLLLGHGEALNNGRHRASINADAFEALLASMYLDSGCDLEPIRRFVLPFVKREIEFISNNSSFIDYKTMLQQIVQQSDGDLLEYVLIGEEGPDHSKTFTIEARLNGDVIGKGAAHSKREAEQLAAKEALVLFGEKF